MSDPAHHGPQVAGIRRISDATMKTLETESKNQVSEKLKNATEGTALHRLALSLSLLDMLKSTTLGSDNNLTLAQFDDDARNTLSMRESQLERLADDLLVCSDATAAFEQAYNEAKRIVLGPGYQSAIAQFANFIVSDAFYASLPSHGAARKDALASEMSKLRALDPELATRTAAEFLGMEIAHAPGRVISEFTLDECVDAVYQVLSLLAEIERSQRACHAPGAGQGAKGQDAKIVGESVGMQSVLAGLKTGATCADTSKKVADLLENTAKRMSIARDLAKGLKHRSSAGMLGDDAKIAKSAEWLQQNGYGKAAAVATWLQDHPMFGRGLASFTGLVALAGVAFTFSFRDSKGNINWDQVLGGASTVASSLGNAPTYIKFFKEDSVNLAKTVMRREGVQLAKTAAEAGASCTAVAAKASRFVRFCKVMGPVGDVLSLPVGCYAIKAELENEDTVGVVCQGVAMGSSVLGLFALAAASGSTGIGLPLAALAIAAGLAALLVDWAWGESAMTGDIKKKLRYLEITSGEDEVYRKLAQRTVTRTGSYGGYNVGGTYTYKAQQDLPHKTVRSNARAASIQHKQALINKYMEGSTSGSQETLIFQVLKDTRGNNDEFLQLVESIDTKVLADELETGWQARSVMSWIVSAYTKAGRPPTNTFGDFFEHLCSQHRSGVINDFFKYLSPVDKKTFQKHDAPSVRRGTEKLMDNTTYNSDERAIYEILKATSYPQFNAVVEGGKRAYAARLQDELESYQWNNVRRWMLDTSPGKATAEVRSIGLSVR